MQPVLIFRHAAHEGPGHFAAFLQSRGIAHELVRIDAGDAVPASVEGSAGLAFMGGPMSANDSLPWVAQEIRLIQRAIEAGVPVIGHCLGGQLMARALGAEVTRNPVQEIGWFPVEVVESDTAKRWLGSRSARSFPAYHWHGETFAIPAGATRLLASRDCPNQAFALGPHLALQCHVEMTPELIADWAQRAGERLRPSASVQSAAEMVRDAGTRTRELHRVADALYERWIEGLRRAA